MVSYATLRGSRTNRSSRHATSHSAWLPHQIAASRSGALRSPLCALASHVARFAIAMLLLGCSAVSSSSDKPPNVQQRAQFERDASVTIPASATLVAWHEERGMDSAVWLEFKIPAADFAAFIDASPLQKTVLSASDKYQENQFRDLLAVPPAHYRAGQQALPNGRVLNMLADESNAGIVVVYLMLHET